MSDHKTDIAELLRAHGRADDLNALAEDTKRLKHSEREAVIAAQEACMKAADEIDRLRAALLRCVKACFTEQAHREFMSRPDHFVRQVLGPNVRANRETTR